MFLDQKGLQVYKSSFVLFSTLINQGGRGTYGGSGCTKTADFWGFFCANTFKLSHHGWKKYLQQLVGDSGILKTLKFRKKIVKRLNYCNKTVDTFSFNSTLNLSSSV